jgi:hypothetical protein
MLKGPLLAIAFASAVATAPLAAQPGSPNTTPGVVTRVTLVRILPGHADMFWQDVRQNLRPIWEEQKRRGIIVDYAAATKTTLEDPEDWNVAITVSYRNWSVLDGFGARADSVSLGHYGTAAARTAANNARLEHSKTIASFLIRAQAINPWR